MSAVIQAYIRRTAAAGRDTEQIGPFLATFARHSTNPFLNYAIPDPGAQPTPDDVAALAAAYERRGRIPRLEYLPKLAPDVELAGFGVREKFRRRGIAGAITSYLTIRAHRAGATFVFLTPESEPVARIYRRVGFHAIDEVVVMSRRVTTS